MSYFECNNGLGVIEISEFFNVLLRVLTFMILEQIYLFLSYAMLITVETMLSLINVMVHISNHKTKI